MKAIEYRHDVRVPGMVQCLKAPTCLEWGHRSESQLHVQHARECEFWQAVGVQSNGMGGPGGAVVGRGRKNRNCVMCVLEGDCSPLLIHAFP